MAEKEALERRHADLRLKLVRTRAGRDKSVDEAATVAELARLRSEIQSVDDRLGPLAKRASEIANPYWGPLMWAGNDKSHFARQVERYADVYTSRVSNFARATPFVYLRSPRGALPHDEAPAIGGTQKRG
jgi:5'-nucleotidase